MSRQSPGLWNDLKKEDKKVFYSLLLIIPYLVVYYAKDKISIDIPFTCNEYILLMCDYNL